MPNFFVEKFLEAFALLVKLPCFEQLGPVFKGEHYEFLLASLKDIAVPVGISPLKNTLFFT